MSCFLRFYTRNNSIILSLVLYIYKSVSFRVMVRHAIIAESVIRIDLLL